MPKILTVKFEVSDDVTPEQMHEALCKVIYENDPDQGAWLCDSVADIQEVVELKA